MADKEAFVVNPEISEPELFRAGMLRLEAARALVEAASWPAADGYVHFDELGTAGTEGYMTAIGCLLEDVSTLFSELEPVTKPQRAARGAS